jgi:hypothetical protein
MAATEALAGNARESLHPAGGLAAGGFERREHLLGIAEKMPKSPVKLPKTASSRLARRPIVALEPGNATEA